MISARVARPWPRATHVQDLRAFAFGAGRGGFLLAFGLGGFLCGPWQPSSARRAWLWHPWRFSGPWARPSSGWHPSSRRPLSGATGAPCSATAAVWVAFPVAWLFFMVFNPFVCQVLARLRAHHDSSLRLNRKARRIFFQEKNDGHLAYGLTQRRAECSLTAVQKGHRQQTDHDAPPDGTIDAERANREWTEEHLRRARRSAKPSATPERRIPPMHESPAPTGDPVTAYFAGTRGQGEFSGAGG